ncbi:MAG: phosphoenolpyruvate carboxykinase (ATP), partial [Thermomicrobiales bacterium]
MAAIAERSQQSQHEGPERPGAALSVAGISNPGEVYWNLPIPRLVEEALARGEGELAANGALTAQTGKYTGRSPDDKFVVDHPAYHEQIWWGKVNQPLAPEK